MKAFAIQSTRIHCDSCGYEFPDVPQNWLGKPCPECAAPDIITATDIAYFNMVNALADFSNELLGDVPDGTKTRDVRFSSAQFRRDTPKTDRKDQS